MFPSRNLFPSLSHLRALRASLLVLRTHAYLSVTQTLSVTFIPSNIHIIMATAKMKGSTFPRYEQNHFFPFPVVRKLSRCFLGTRISRSRKDTWKRRRKSKLLGPELFSFDERFFNQKENKIFLGGGCALTIFLCSSCVLLLDLCFIVLNKQHARFFSSFIKQLKTQVIIVRQPSRSPVLTEPATIERVFRPLDAGRG